jgi:hypothetical protein
MSGCFWSQCREQPTEQFAHARFSGLRDLWRGTDPEVLERVESNPPRRVRGLVFRGYATFCAGRSSWSWTVDGVLMSW